MPDAWLGILNSCKSLNNPYSHAWAIAHTIPSAQNSHTLILYNPNSSGPGSRGNFLFILQFWVQEILIAQTTSPTPQPIVKILSSVLPKLTIHFFIIAFTTMSLFWGYGHQYLLNTSQVILLCRQYQIPDLDQWACQRGYSEGTNTLSYFIKQCLPTSCYNCWFNSKNYSNFNIYQLLKIKWYIILT